MPTIGRIPRRSETTASLPDSEGTGPRPLRAQSQLPVGMVPKFPPRTYAILTVAAALQGRAAARASAALASAATLKASAVPNQFATAILTVSSNLRADVLNQSAQAKLTVTAGLKAASSATADAKLGTAATLSGAARATANATLPVTATLSGVARPTTDGKLTVTAALAASASTFIASGLTKTSPSFSITTNYGQVTDWNTDSGSTQSGNGLVVNGNKAAAKCEASLVCTNGAFGARNITLRLKLNGTVIGTGSTTAVPGNGSATVVVTVTGQTVTNGQNLTVEAVGDNSGVTIAANSASYLRCT